jgi:hypothetical protein
LGFLLKCHIFRPPPSQFWKIPTCHAENLKEISSILASLFSKVPNCKILLFVLPENKWQKLIKIIRWRKVNIFVSLSQENGFSPACTIRLCLLRLVKKAQQKALQHLLKKRVINMI